MAGTTPGLLRDSRPEHHIPAGVWCGSRSVSAPLPWGAGPSNNHNPGRPSGDATKRSCLYD